MQISMLIRVGPEKAQGSLTRRLWTLTLAPTTRTLGRRNQAVFRNANAQVKEVPMDDT